MPVEFEDYHDIVAVSDPRPSPDGDRVAFVRTEPDGEAEYESTIYVASEDGEPRRFTLAAHEDAQPRWSPSGDRLAFASSRGDGGQSLWVLPTDGGEARRVTDVVGDVADVVWSPDGETVAFTQEVTAAEQRAGHDTSRGDEYERADPDPREIDRHVYRQFGEYRDGKRRHVYAVSLASESVTRITSGDVDHSHPEWGDADTLYYAARQAEAPDDDLVYDIVAQDCSTGETREVTRTTGWLPAFSVAPDGRVAYRKSDLDPPGPSMRTTDVAVYDPETGESRRVTEGFDRRVYRGAKPQWGPRGESLYFLVPDEGSVDLYAVPADGSAGPTAVVQGDGHIEEATVAGGAVAFVRSAWDHPGDVFLASLADGTARRVTEVNAEYLAGTEVVEPEEVRFESGDGTEVQGWLLRPPGFDPERRYPLVVEVHGGPTIMWSTSGSMWHEFQSLAARGYAVFWCNPRGSSGYGEAHSTAIAEDWGAVDSADVLAGVEAVCERGWVDDGNVFLTGGSYGGFLTAWLLGHSDRFAAGVAQRGVYDQVCQFGTTDTYHSSERQLGLPWTDHETYWAASPTAYADRVTAPTLLLHSENDFRVPVANAEVLYRFLKKNGVETKLVRYPRETHELSRSGEPAHVVDRLQRIGEWFDGYSDHHDAAPVETGGDGDEWPAGSAE